MENRRTAHPYATPELPDCADPAGMGIVRCARCGEQLVHGDELPARHEAPLGWHLGEDGQWRCVVCRRAARAASRWQPADVGFPWALAVLVGAALLLLMVLLVVHGAANWRLG